MLPEFAGVATYYSAWLVAALWLVLAGLFTLGSQNVPWPRRIVFLLSVVLAVVAGAKTAYLLERWFCGGGTPFRAPDGFSGFRLPGGILLAALWFPFVTRGVGLEPRATADRLLLPAWVAVAVVHLGCLLNGCCFGTRSSLPWAVALGQTTITFGLHRSLGWLPEGQTVTEPVHPLPAYFSVLALAVAIFRPCGRAVSAPPGTRFWNSVSLYAVGSLALEFLRPVLLWVNLITDLCLVATALAFRRRTSSLGPGSVAASKIRGTAAA